jgi:uncharacterized integral membrane protein (TIGR00697 family)
MDHFVIKYLGDLAYGMHTEALSMILLFFCFATMLYLWKYWQENGLYVYNVLAVIVANIQVLKLTSVSFISEPMAIGTIVFATTFTASDILTEHKGIKAAQTGIKLSFIAQIIMTTFMIITLLYPSSGDIQGISPAGDIADKIQFSMFMIFAPSIRILTASLISFYISQQVDVYIFRFLKARTHKKLLWLRLNIATLVSGLLDNILFSTMAWMLFSPEPVTMRTLIITYILGTYGARVIVSLASTPVLYLSYYFIGKKKTL